MRPLDEYSMIENINPKIGWLKVIAINYCIFSPMLSIYLEKQKEYPKSYKASSFFVRFL